MTRADGILRDRVRNEAALYLRRFGIGMSAALAISPILVALVEQLGLRSEPGVRSTATWGMVLMFDGMVIMLSSMTALWEKKNRYPNPLGRSFVKWLASTTNNFSPSHVDADAVGSGGASWVTIEGSMTCAPESSALTSPLCGSPCLYYHVLVEQWTERRYPQDPWSKCGHGWQLAAFLLTNESGSVLVEAPNEARSVNDDVDAFMSISSRTTIFESPAGVHRLPPRFQEYLESNRKRFLSIDICKRTRVTELTLVEGDHISMMGHIQERAISTGAVRNERLRVVDSGSPLKIFASRLEEFRRLDAFHRRFVLALLITSVLGALVIGLGAYLL